MRLKCRYGGETRIAIVQPEHDFSQLKKRLSNDYGFEVALKYEDCDGEMITLSTQHDFDDMFHVGQEAINVHVHASPTGQLPKLHIDTSTMKREEEKSIDSTSNLFSSSSTSALPAIRGPFGSMGSSSSLGSLSPVPQSDISEPHSPKTMRLHSAKAVVGGVLLAAHDNAVKHMLSSKASPHSQLIAQSVNSSSNPAFESHQIRGNPAFESHQTQGNGAASQDSAGIKTKKLVKNSDLSQSAGSLTRSSAVRGTDRYVRLVNVALSVEPLCSPSRPRARGAPAAATMSPALSVKSPSNALTREYSPASYLPFLPTHPRNLDVFVSVEHCCNCAAHGFSLWHDEDKYESLAHAALAAIISRFALNDFPVNVYAYCSRASGSRIGAFEVSIALWVGSDSGGSGDWQTHTLHSKLYSSTFPHIRRLAVGAENFLQSALRFHQSVPASRLTGVPLPAAGFAGLEVGSAQWRKLVSYIDRVGLSIDRPGIKADESLYHPYLINSFVYRSAYADTKTAAPLLEPYEGLHLQAPGAEDRSVEALLRWQRRVLEHFRVF